MAKNYKPSECIFAIVKNPDDLTEGWLVYVTPKSYFEKHKYMYDQHLFDIPGLDQLMEAIYEGPDDPQALHDLCVKAGLTWSESLTKFVGAQGAAEGGEVFTPGGGIEEAVEESFWQPSSGKVETADCTYALSKILMTSDWIDENRPDWVHWSDAENWKRKSKTKDGAFDARTFAHREKDCPFEVKIQATKTKINNVCFLENGALIYCASEGFNSTDNTAEKAEEPKNKLPGGPYESGDYRFFTLYFGYAESGSIGSLTIQHETGAKSPEMALGHFIEVTRHIMKQTRLEDASSKLQNCCKDTLQKMPGAKFCATCKNNLAAMTEEVSDEEVTEYLQNLLGLINDSWGYEDWEKYQKWGWNVPGPYGHFVTDGKWTIVHNFNAPLNTDIEWHILDVKPMGSGAMTRCTKKGPHQ